MAAGAYRWRWWGQVTNTWPSAQTYQLPDELLEYIFLLLKEDAQAADLKP